jgi:hypothetical protein
MKRKRYISNFTILVLSLLLGVTISCNQSNNVENTKTQDGQDQQKNTNVSNENAGVYFVNLKNGDTVKSPVIIQMGIRGMEVEPAGAFNESKGHHHLIVDQGSIEKGVMVPMDDTHIHFGKGQNTDTLKLSPGQHTLTLQFADGLHRSYGKEWSTTITIVVKQ